MTIDSFLCATHYTAYIKSHIILHLVPFVVPAQNQDIDLAITALT